MRFTLNQSFDEVADFLLKFLSPLCLILGPIASLTLTHAIWTEWPNLTVSVTKISFAYLFCVAMSWAGFYYCKKYWGWFSSTKRQN